MIPHMIPANPLPMHPTHNLLQLPCVGQFAHSALMPSEGSKKERIDTE